ncbi:mannitol-1-phosphate 5-dehydrogenase [Salmonella enterica]|uniref:Mannitol-1-phosphate 5-dehydrogenase n=1 Tax=Salmonella enterica TaxID=28901 RepID=A0A3K8YHB8_SALER|nr:mannitol-1-phosphate 5-dehydrogenase [Citrobacter freundii]EAO9613459.1 mannitol-1-phosphate 5-dehydrogenase [Salmonella enterica]EAP1482667.1 mannitol-1-phosphate 5-dehydrogenase [Salmonella enterica]EAU5157671.1 mannitol-1-phosphate 5-dehydrogenase [Salmonella enterica]EAX1826270.1 mannitol-1-phosphate 5-dehydrogenase [Salmonella enterica]EAX6893115.1 mannitol-1-phosphate 5-dehydrogenase [Salmonella enterica]
MKAVHFGAGNIGRGFIGDLLHNSGYHITFVEVGQKVVDSLNATNSYDIYFLDKGYEKKTITNVNAVSPVTSPDDVVASVVAADLITTSVWADNLPKISAILAKGLKARKLKGMPKVNVLACENALYASDRLRNEVLKHTDIITEAELDAIACFANVSVDRLALTNVREGVEYLDIDTMFELVIEQNRLVDTKSEPIKGADYTDNLTMYLERKLYICNCGHAAAGYLGFIKGYQYVQQAFADKAIFEDVKGMMYESADALIRKFGFEFDELDYFIKKNIKRFTMDVVQDDIKRVCRSPVRKLDKTDRLVAPCESYESLVGEVKYLPKAIAAVFMFKNSEDVQAVELQDYISAHGIENAISHFTGLENGSSIFNKVLAEFKKFNH